MHPRKIPLGKGTHITESEERGDWCAGQEFGGALRQTDGLKGRKTM